MNNRTLRIKKLLRGTPILKKPKPHRCLVFMVRTPQGVISKEENLQAYCAKRGLSQGCASDVFHGSRRQHKGYIFWRPDD